MRTRAECREVAVVAGMAGTELGTPAPSGASTDPNLAISNLLLALRLVFQDGLSYYHIGREKLRTRK